MEPQIIEGAESAKPHKTWFIERGDGFVFAAREQEAWDLLKNRTNWMRHDFKIVGVSDGTTYHRVLREGRSQLPQLERESQELQKEIGEYSETERYLKFKELVDEGDERLAKVKRLKADLNAKLQKKLEEIQEVTTGLERKAFDAEFEVAKGNIEMPSNQDVITPSQGDRNTILSNLPRR